MLGVVWKKRVYGIIYSVLLTAAVVAVVVVVDGVKRAKQTHLILMYFEVTPKRARLLTTKAQHSSGGSVVRCEQHGQI